MTFPTQYHLSAVGMCGRGVRIRELSQSEIEEAILSATESADPDTKLVELNMAEQREQVMRMLVAVTKDNGLTEKQLRELPPTGWETLTLQKLKTPGPFSLDALFGAKDINFLKRIFQKRHVITAQEMDDLEGKACAVATEGAPQPSGSGTGTAG